MTTGMQILAEGMGARWIAALGLFFFGLAYKYYANWLASKRNFDLDDSAKTPAHEFEDGVDFVPTNSHVLFGHHFTSIAGAAPIVGPALAVIWGWLPALLWVVFGSIFIGCVHDFANLVVSAKNKGKSLADLTGEIVGPVSRRLFLFLVMLLTWIVLAVFAFVIANLFSGYADTVIPVNLEILMAVVIGFMIYKKKTDAFWPSVVVLLLLYGSIIFFAGKKEMVPESLRQVSYSAQQFKEKQPEKFENVAQKIRQLEGGGISTEKVEEKAASELNTEHNNNAKLYWIFFLLIYSGIASVLPVWLLLQPRDFINSHQLIVGLGLMFISVIIFNPGVDAPVVRWEVPIHAHEGDMLMMPLFPFLFITIACGAVSGFHGLVASGTTSKQLNRMKDAKPIGYGAMLGEASLALMATIACVAGFASSEKWNHHYESWAGAKGLGAKLGAFVEGGANFLNEIFQTIGVSAETGMSIGRSVVAVLVISFAATTLDSACRIQRFIIGELGEGFKLKILSNRFVASAIAALTPLILVLMKNDAGKPYWSLLWPLFGSTNQLLGALALLIITIYLVRKGKNFWITFLPMVFLMIMTYTAMITHLIEFYEKKNTLLVTIGCCLLALALWISFEGIRVLIAHKKGTLKEGFVLK